MVGACGAGIGGIVRPGSNWTTKPGQLGAGWWEWLFRGLRSKWGWLAVNEDCGNDDMVVVGRCPECIPTVLGEDWNLEHDPCSPGTVGRHGLEFKVIHARHEYGTSPTRPSSIIGQTKTAVKAIYRSEKHIVTCFKPNCVPEVHSLTRNTQCI